MHVHMQQYKNFPSDNEARFEAQFKLSHYLSKYKMEEVENTNDMYSKIN